LSLLKCKKLDYSHSSSEPAQKKIHPEREEKPVQPATMEYSKETHGGGESTDSIPSSPNTAIKAGKQRKGPDQIQTQAQGPGTAKDVDDQEEVSGASEGNNSAESKGNGFEENEAARGSIHEEGYNTEEAIASHDGEGFENEEGANGDGFEGGEGVKASEDDGDEGGIYVGEYNTEQVVDLSYHRTSLYLATEFYRLLELLMEEKTKVFDSRGVEEYNVRKLILRPYEKKPLSHYMQARVKESIIILLDNSGSMDWWAENLQLLASIALSRDDVEIYAAPNGAIQTRLTNRGYVPVDHEEVVRKLRGRRIVYVGDFDGANTPVELSFSNDVIWICPEMRYRRFKAHDWVDYTEEDFRGVFIRAWTLDEVFSALKKVDRFYNMWIDLHEGHIFEDDLDDGEGEADPEDGEEAEIDEGGSGWGG
jgi:hypothetical protein